MDVGAPEKPLLQVALQTPPLAVPSQRLDGHALLAGAPGSFCPLQAAGAQEPQTGDQAPFVHVAFGLPENPPWHTAWQAPPVAVPLQRPGGQEALAGAGGRVFAPQDAPNKDGLQTIPRLITCMLVAMPCTPAKRVPRGQ